MIPLTEAHLSAETHGGVRVIDFGGQARDRNRLGKKLRLYIFDVERGSLMSQSLFDLSGRVAVVTGGTTGIGHAIARGLAEAGADVVPSSRRSEQVEKAAAEI